MHQDLQDAQSQHILSQTQIETQISPVAEEPSLKKLKNTEGEPAMDQASIPAISAAVAGQLSGQLGETETRIS